MLEVTVQDTGNGGGERLIADQVICADTPALRRKGLLGRQTLDPDEGALLFIRCTARGLDPPRLGLSLFHSIHMFGVPFELATAWLDEKGTILDAKHARPGRMVFPSGIFTRSRYILEVHTDHLPLLQVGHRVRWREAVHE
jgi:uncharacterized membrane protein (UPF0127 family)